MPEGQSHSTLHPLVQTEYRGMEIGWDVEGITAVCKNMHTHALGVLQSGFSLKMVWRYTFRQILSYIQQSLHLDTYYWLVETPLWHPAVSWLHLSRLTAEVTVIITFFANCGLKKWGGSNIWDTCCASCQSNQSQKHMMTHVCPHALSCQHTPLSLRLSIFSLQSAPLNITGHV